MLSVLTKFLSNRSQYVVVDGCRSKLVNVLSGVPQGSVLGPQLLLFYTAKLFSIVENKLCSYADDSTLVAVVPSSSERVAVSESINRDLNRVSVWCNLWGMKLNARKTKTMIVSRSHTVHPQLTILTLDGIVLKESADLVILEVTFDTNMTFEKHLRSVSSAAAQRLGIMRKSWQLFHDRSLLLRSFWSFVLTVLEYCSAVRCSAADSHLKLLVSLWNDLSEPVFDGVGLAGFKSRANAFLLALICSFFLSLTVLYFSSFHGGWLCGVGVFGLIVFSLSPGLAERIPNNNNNNNNNNLFAIE